MEIIKQNVSCLKPDTFKAPRKASKKTISLLPNSIFVVIVSKVIPEKKLLRIEFPHGSKNVDTCIIVKDVHKLDYNKTINVWKERWQKELTKSGVEPSKLPVTFMPLRELTIGYQPFSSKRRLFATFDVFIADRRIVHHLPSKLGKAFYGQGRGKLPVPVDVVSPKLVQLVQKAVNTVLFAVKGTGTTESIPIGSVEMPLEDLKENIIHLCEQVCLHWPTGGLANIRSIYVQTSGVSFPVFFDAGEAPMSSICESLDRLPQARRRDQPVAVEKQPPEHKLTPELIGLVEKELPIPKAVQNELLASNLAGKREFGQGKRRRKNTASNAVVKKKPRTATNVKKPKAHSK